MIWRNRIGVYGGYFLGLSGIGFTLPYLPPYLREQGMSDRAIGIVSTLAALAGLAQMPLGLWSDRVGRRKPFLVVLLAVLTLSTWLLHAAQGVIWLSVLVVLFAENGLCRATSESLFGAEVARLARPGQVGAALGALRFWKPLGVIAVALMGSVLAEHHDMGSILVPLAVIQALAVVAVLLIREEKGQGAPAAQRPPTENGLAPAASGSGLRDRALLAFVAAMLLFHVANAPGGAYLGLFLQTDLKAPPRMLSYAFIIDMLAWMLVVWPAGRLADRLGRKPLLLVGWSATTLRLVLVAMAQEPWQVLAVEVLDGLAQGLFIVLAGAWVTDRLADPRRVGEAQVLVGSALVAGSAIGPTLAGLVVDSLGYRGMFWLLGGIAALATLVLAVLVPETLAKRPEAVTKARSPLSSLSVP